MEKFSVLIPDGESEFALFAMHGFMNIPEVKVYILSNDRWIPSRFSRRCNKFFYRPAGRDPQRRIAAVREVVAKTGAEILLPVGLDWIQFAGLARAELSEFISVAPVPKPEAYAIVNNKWSLAQFLESIQIPGPPTIIGKLDDSFEQRLNSLKFPVLVKPVTAWGGEGIHRFETKDDFMRFLDEYGRENFNNRYIIQSFLEGYVVGLNVLCQHGQILAHTMQRGIIPNSQKWAAAGAIQFIAKDGVLEVAQRLIGALCWSGFGNFDMFFDTQDNQIKILELNSRFWGSLRGSYVAGVNFPYLACLAGLGIPFSRPVYQLAQYAHAKTALKNGLSKFLRKGGNNHFSIEETGLKFLLKDPVAETVRAFRQEIATDEWR